MSAESVCPSCGAEVDGWSIFLAPTPNRIGCPSCSAQLRFAQSAGHTVLISGGVLLVILAATLVGLSMTRRPIPVGLFVLAAVSGFWAILEFIYLSRRGAFEVVCREGQQVYISERQRRRRTALAYGNLAAASVFVLLALAWLAVHLSGWDGYHSGRGYIAGALIEVEGGSFQIRVPEGWRGSSVVFADLPDWTGLDNPDGGLAGHLYTTVNMSDPEVLGLYINAYSDERPWREGGFESPSHVLLDGTLEALGVRNTRIARDGEAPPGTVDTTLFVSRPEGDYLIAVCASCADEDTPTADAVVRALEDSGLVLP